MKIQNQKIIQICPNNLKIHGLIKKMNNLIEYKNKLNKKMIKNYYKRIKKKIKHQQNQQKLKKKQMQSKLRKKLKGNL